MAQRLSTAHRLLQKPLLSQNPKWHYGVHKIHHLIAQRQQNAGNRVLTDARSRMLTGDDVATHGSKWPQALA